MSTPSEMLNQTPQVPADGERFSTAATGAARLAERWANVEAPAQEDQDQTVPQASLGPESTELEGEVLPETDAEGAEVDEPVESGEHETDDNAESEIWRGTIEELCEATGADFANLTARIKVDGELLEVPVEEALLGYSREADYRRKTQELSEQRKQAEATWGEKLRAIANVEEQAKAAAGVLGQIAQRAEAEVHERYRHIDWTALRMQDPGEYAARQSEYDRALNEARHLGSFAQQKLHEAGQMAEWSKSQQRAEQAQVNLSRLQELRPEWVTNPEKATADGQKIVNHLKTRYPWTDDSEFEDMDPRVLDLAADAFAYRELMARQAEVQKRGVTSLTPIKPGRSNTPRQLNALGRGREIRQLQERAKDTGKLDDAAAVLAKRWGS